MPRKQTLAQVQKEIGARLRAARLAAGMTQEKTADAAGIEHKRYQRLERGIVNPTVKTLLRVARALETDFWEMLSPNR